MPDYEIEFTREVALTAIRDYEETMYGLDGTGDNEVTVFFKTGERFAVHEWCRHRDDRTTNFESLDARLDERCFGGFCDGVVIADVPTDCYRVVENL